MCGERKRARVRQRDCVCFFFNDTATTEIYTLSLHDALPILCVVCVCVPVQHLETPTTPPASRSEEHTSELQSHLNLVCRLLLEKKLSDRLVVGEKPRGGGGGQEPGERRVH